MILTEEVTIRPLTSEKEHIAVVSDGAVSLVGVVQMSTLSLGFHWTDYIRQPKEREKLLCMSIYYC